MIGLTRDEKHVYRWNDGALDSGPLPSITTVMKAVDKSGPLVGWAQRETAAAAIRNLDKLSEHLAAHRMPSIDCALCASTPAWDGPATAATAWLKRMPGYERDKSADLGTRVHALAESVSLGHEVELAEDEAPYVAAYRQWMEDEKPVFIALEYMVCSLTHRYAGTGDIVALVRGVRWRLDTKTGKDVYPDTGLQLAAADRADFCGIPGDPKKYLVPRAERHGVLHLRADGTYRVVPYRVGDDTFAAFLAARRLWDWLQGPAKTIKEEEETKAWAA